MKIDKYNLVEFTTYFDKFADQKPGDMFYSKDIECVRFHCPCGCGQQVYLRVVPMSERDTQKANDPEAPLWGFDYLTVTLAPSIQQTGGCASHYHIQNSKTVW